MHNAQSAIPCCIPYFRTLRKCTESDIPCCTQVPPEKCGVVKVVSHFHHYLLFCPICLPVGLLRAANWFLRWFRKFAFILQVSWFTQQRNRLPSKFRMRESPEIGWSLRVRQEGVTTRSYDYSFLVLNWLVGGNLSRTTNRNLVALPFWLHRQTAKKGVARQNCSSTSEDGNTGSAEKYRRVPKGVSRENVWHGV